MKYALIGCGRVAVNHLKAALDNNLEIVAVCDTNGDCIDSLLAKYDLNNQNILFLSSIFYLSILTCKNP